MKNPTLTYKAIRLTEKLVDLLADYILAKGRSLEELGYWLNDRAIDEKVKNDAQ